MGEQSDSIEIEVPPEKIFEAISELSEMSRYSPENTGGEWLDGASGPALGARFKGTNANGTRAWTTTATIVAYRPPTAFAFEVTVGPVKVARWTYSIEPTDSGAKVTESWIDRRSALSKRIGAVSSGRRDRHEFTATSIRTTLENLKRALEAST